MSRWINVDDYKDAMGGVYGEYWKEVLDQIGGIDLVTCAECKFKSLYDGETKYYYCALEDRPNRQWSVDDWNYCYWGERKENE